MTSYGYRDYTYSCMIWFHFDCIMQLKLSYYIATNVSSRKSATTFGGLLDCLTNVYVGESCGHHDEHVIIVLI